MATRRTTAATTTASDADNDSCSSVLDCRIPFVVADYSHSSHLCIWRCYSLVYCFVGIVFDLFTIDLLVT